MRVISTCINQNVVVERAAFQSRMMFLIAKIGVIFAFFTVSLTQFSHAEDRPDSFADLAERLSPSVVNISTATIVEGRPGFDMPQFPPGSPF